MHVAQDEKMVKVMKSVVPEPVEDLSQAFACKIVSRGTSCMDA